MKRRSRLAVVLAVAGLLTAGCGRDEGGGGGDAARPVGEGRASGEITVWAMGAEGEKLGGLAKDFERENPGVTVKVTPIPWDGARAKIANGIAGRQTPDISLVGTTWMAEFARSGALDATPPDLVDKSAFFEGAWDTTVADGTSYGVPWYVETRLIYYRKDLAAQVGVASPPKTWDELKSLAKAYQEKGGAKWGLSLQPGGTGSWQTFLPFGWQNGAEVLDGDSFQLDSSEMAQALEYYQSFFTEGLSPRALGEGAMEPGFVDGQIGAFVSGPWHLKALEDQGGPGFLDKVGVAHMPMGSRAATSFVGGGNLAVFKDAKNRDSAWKFVAWLSTPEIQAKWYKTVGNLPSVKDAWNDEALTADPMLAAFGDQLKDAKSPPTIPTWEQVAAVIDGEIEKACRGGASAVDSVKAMQSKATGIGTGA